MQARMVRARTVSYAAPSYLAPQHGRCRESARNVPCVHLPNERVMIVTA